MEFNKNFFEQANLDGDTLYDKFYDFFVYSKLLESEENIKHGEVYTIEESKERLRKKYENCNI